MTRQLHFIHNNSGLFYIYIFVNAGVIYEDVKKLGISHMLEHMIFKRSKHMTTEDILRESTKIGGVFNAATDTDVTYFYFKTSSEKYERAIRIFAELLTVPMFTHSDLARERQVVLEEMNKGLDNNDRVLWSLSSLSVLPDDNPYSRKVIGTEETLMSITTRDIKKYFEERYKDCFIVVNCEKKIEGNVKKLVRELFKGHIDGGVAGDYDFPRELERKIIVFNQDLNQNNIILTFPMFRSHLNLKKTMIMDFISYILSGAGLYSLLVYQLREKRNLIYSASSFSDVMKYLTTFRIFTASSHENVKDILAVIFMVLKELKTKGLEPKKLRFFKKSYINSMRVNMSSEDYKTLAISTQLFNTDGKEAVDENIILRTAQNITNEDIIKLSTDLFIGEDMGILCMGAFKETQNLSNDLMDFAKKLFH
jgi:predicted Zn-dependent peptidase